MNEIETLKDFVKKNIPNAEILNVSHTERIFNRDGDDCDCHPIKEGLMILIRRE